jgi:hypothetical protein
MSFIDLSLSDQSTLVKSLSLLFNTYWQAGLAPFDQTGVLQSGSGDIQLATSSASSINTSQAYATRWAWLGVLFGCATVLLVVGGASIILEAQSLSPDILGFVASVARNSKYVQARVTSTMGGAERARLLRDMQVMMQDVNPRADVGRIALGMAGKGAARLQKDRLYC